MSLNHVMLDLETLGTDPGSVILSIGAVQFSLETGDTGLNFYSNIDLKSCIDAGLKIDADTLKWWLVQSQEARDKAFGDPAFHLTSVLTNFNYYIEKISAKDIPLYVWGNSNRFDLGILDTAYQAVNRKYPWNFRNERDVRTLVHFAPEVKANQKFTGTAHDPIDDCHHQIKYCHKIYKQLNHDNAIQKRL